MFIKSCAIVLPICFVLLFVSGCSQPAREPVKSVPTPTPPATATATPDVLAFARANYAVHCSECHGVEGKGGLVTVEDRKLEVPSLIKGHALKHTDEDFVEQITSGDEEMPAFRDKLSPDEINALVDFIRKEFQGKDEL